MTNQRFTIALALANLALLLFTLVRQISPAFAEGTAPVLRGRGLEIVDDRGRIRASISVLPAGKSERGDAYPETVLLRLVTERGRPSVKISASEQGSGLSFAGPTNTKNTYLVLQSGESASSLKLRNEDGRELVVKP